MPTLKSVFIPASLPGNYLTRPLLDQLKANKKKKMIFLKAGEGYGKTTLLTSYYQYIKDNKCWISIPANLFSLKRLFAHMIYHLKDSLPNRVEPFELYTMLTTEEIMIELINILTEEITDEIYFFFDDLHHLILDQHELDIVNSLLPYLPPSVHLIISSERDIPFVVNHLAASDLICRVEQVDFTLSFKETDQYLAEFNPGLPLETVNKIYKLSAGWIAIIPIITENIISSSIPENNQTINNLESVIKEDKNIKSYFDNIINNLSTELQYFLSETSFFNNIEVELANSYLDIKNSQLLLHQLTELNLVNKSKQGYYFYSNILQNILNSKFSPEELINRYSRLADLYLERKRHEEAVDYLLKSDREIEALSLMHNHLNESFNDIPLVQNWLAKIPEEKLKINSELAFYRAIISERLNRFQEALEYYQIALSLYQQTGNDSKVIESKIQIAGIYWHQENFQKAIDLCLNLLPVVKEGDHFTLATIYNLLGTARIELNSVSEGEEYLKESLKYCRLADNSNKEAWILNNLSYNIYLPLGNFQEAIATYQKALDLFNNSDDISGRLLILANLTSLYLQIDDTAKAGQLLAEVKNILFKMSKTNSYPVYLILKCRLEIRNKNFQEANSYLDMIQRNSLNKKFYRAQLAFNYSQLYTEKMQYDKALFYINKGINLCREYTNQLQSLEFHLQKARVLYYTKKYKDLVNHLSVIMEIARKNKCQYYLAEALFYQLTVSKILNRSSKNTLPELLDLVKENDYYFIFTKLSFLTVENYPVLQEHLSPDKLPVINQENSNNIKENEVARGKTNSASVKLYKAYLFDYFRIIQGEKIIKSTDWKNKKALNIFKYLLLNIEQRVHQEQLLETFWPGLDISRARQNLYVALYEIRGVLDKESIISENSCYWINQNFIYLLDTKLFRKYYDEGEHYFHKGKSYLAGQYFEKAKIVYGNGLLPEDIYNEWTIDNRTYLQKIYIELVSRLLDIAENNGEIDKGITLAEQLLNIDPYQQETNMSYIKLLIKSGNLKKAFNYYRDLQEIYAKELNTRLPAAISSLIQEAR